MIPDICEHHKQDIAPIGYVARHEWAIKRINQKYTQIRCPVCKLYLFPDQLNELDNPKSIAVIQKHTAYLEAHPKAKDCLTQNMNP
jgi:hypothetical protein